jgi:hypothetical protein
VTNSRQPGGRGIRGIPFRRGIPPGHFAKIARLVGAQAHRQAHAEGVRGPSGLSVQMEVALGDHTNVAPASARASELVPGPRGPMNHHGGRGERPQVDHVVELVDRASTSPAVIPARMAARVSPPRSVRLDGRSIMVRARCRPKIRKSTLRTNDSAAARFLRLAPESP